MSVQGTIVGEDNGLPAAKKSVKRKSELELMRIVACCCIIGIHQVFTYSTEYPLGSFLRILCKGCATTVFFMITGAFLSSRQSFPKQVGRLITKNVIPFLVVTPLILQFWPAMAGQLSWAACFTQWNVSLQGFLRMLFSLHVDAIASPHGLPRPNGGIYHLWFIFALYKCYVFFPLLKLLLVDGQAGQAVKRYVLAAGAVLFLLVPTIKLCVSSESVFARMPEIQMEPFLWLWVMLLGNHLYSRLTRTNISGANLRRLALASAATYLAAMSFNYFLTMRYAVDVDGITVHDTFLERGFIPLFVANIAVFVFFATLRIKSETTGERIRSTANKVFYIYLFHVPVLEILRTTVFANLVYYSVGGKLLVMTSVFVICYFIASLCRYLEKIIGRLWSWILLTSLAPWLSSSTSDLRQSLSRFARK